MNLDAADQRPAVDAFVDYLLSDEGLELAATADSIPLPEQLAGKMRDRWDEVC